MENLIRNFNALKQCHDSVSAEAMLAMPNAQLKSLCVKEKIQFVESLNAVNTQVIIKERIQIKQAKDHERAEKRREYLNQNFK